MSLARSYSYKNRRIATSINLNTIPLTLLWCIHFNTILYTSLPIRYLIQNSLWGHVLLLSKHIRLCSVLVRTFNIFANFKFLKWPPLNFLINSKCPDIPFYITYLLYVLCTLKAFMASINLLTLGWNLENDLVFNHKV